MQLGGRGPHVGFDEAMRALGPCVRMVAAPCCAPDYQHQDQYEGAEGKCEEQAETLVFPPPRRRGRFIVLGVAHSSLPRTGGNEATRHNGRRRAWHEADSTTTLACRS